VIFTDSNQNKNTNSAQRARVQNNLTDEQRARLIAEQRRRASANKAAQNTQNSTKSGNVVRAPQQNNSQKNVSQASSTVKNPQRPISQPNRAGVQNVPRTPQTTPNRNAVPTRAQKTVAEGDAATRPLRIPQTSTQGNSTTSPKQSAQVSQNARAQMQGMMKTRNTDIYPVRDVKRLPSEKKPDNTIDRGNTVISVVKAVMYIIFVIVVSIFLSLFIIMVGNDVFALVKSNEVVEVTIPEDADIDDVADVLYQNDIIKYPQVFKIYAKIKKDDGEFLAGNYSVNGMMNYDTLLAEFKEKFVMEIVEIKIPEGYTTDEIIDLFLSYGIGTREGFVDVIENYDFDYWFVKLLDENGTSDGRIYRLDGYLFPDTYQFYTTSSEMTVINKLLKRFSQIFTKEYRDQCEKMGYSVDQIVTLASMIEKEAGSPREFFAVSSVFHNRLNAPHIFPKLESDATIVYALQHETGVRPNLTAEDLMYDTPYNSYLYDGLPPGAIANPSASALLAALQPQETKYYFFIANRGTTHFSETKAEHDALKAQFKAEASDDQQLSGNEPNV